MTHHGPILPPLLADQRRGSNSSIRTRLSHPPQFNSSHRESFDSSSHPTLISAQYRPRPHPHLHSQVLFIDHVPSDLPEQEIAQALQECLPVRITLGQSVPPHLRLKPDAYYDWMPKSGKLEFDQQHNAEKALATLHIHPLLASRGITVSPFPSPQLVPLAESPARHLRPTLRVSSPSVPATGIRDPLASCPSPGAVFDSLRPWGSLRMVQVWAEVPPEGAASLPAWSARVEFWYEDEAKRFEVGFGQTASIIKGWQIAILTELPTSMPIMQPTFPPILPLQLPPTLPPTPGPIAPLSGEEIKFITPIPYSRASFDPTPGGALQAAIGIMQIPSQQHPGINPQILFPDTPPLTSYTPPWATHNPFTISQTDMPPPAGLPFPVFPTSPPSFGSPGRPPHGSPMTPRDRHVRKMSSISRTSMSSLRSSGRQRTWSVTIGEAPDGGIRATGLVSDDGQFITHGPGQHIRPAPMYGPGSTSASGLVDYSNVFVKNLDPDINSEFLGQLFSNVGRIISARVMRDEVNRSRGYGFVSFHTPEEALRAINAMHGQLVGRQYIAVTLHEPRKLRPEKIAERTLREQPTAYGRTPLHQASLSNLRGSVLSHTSLAPEQKPLGTNDEIRLLSPKTREAALTRRIIPRVKAYARENAIPDSLVKPTVKALVAEDLQIIPLLYDVDRLRDKIAKTISVLHGDTDVTMVFEETKVTPKRAGPVTRSSARNQSPHTPATSSSPANGLKSPLKLSADDLATIRSEVLCIDLADAETIMATLLSRLTPEEAQNCLKNRQHLRLVANGIRRELLKSRMKIDTKVTQLFPIADLPPLSGLSQPSPVSSPTRLRPSNAMDIGDKPIFVRLPTDEVDITKLASLSVEQALAHFDGDEGQLVLRKLGFAKPLGVDIGNMDDFIKKIGRRSPLERRSEVVTLITRCLNYPALRKSQKAKLVRDLANTEDNDEAVCRLTLYPSLLEAKIGQLLGSPLSRRVSA